MEYLSSNIFLVLTWSFTISPITAHYCVWGLCESSEYCCDENACCKNYDIWITVIIIAGVVIGMILAGTCLYYNLCRIYLYLQQRYYGISSVSMPSEFDSDKKSILLKYFRSKRHVCLYKICNIPLLSISSKLDKTQYL